MVCPSVYVSTPKPAANRMANHRMEMKTPSPPLRFSFTGLDSAANQHATTANSLPTAL